MWKDDCQEWKYGDAVTSDIDRLPIEWLVGGFPSSAGAVGVFDTTRINFLAALSERLLGRSEIKKYTDLAAFAFWCRRANIESKKIDSNDGMHRLGWGIALHITPGNVPMNCAFSFAFGLLSGNSNVVRLPSENFPQIALLIGEMTHLFSKAEFAEVAKYNALVRYDRNANVTASLSEISDLRMIWGGDLTINEVRKLECGPRCVDLVFPDRYSFSVICLEALRASSNDELETLTQRFYNDTYLFDQNACSSARLIVWYGKEQADERELFWDRLQRYVESRYEVSLGLSVEKYGRLCSDMLGKSAVHRVVRHGSWVYRVEWEVLPEDSEQYLGRGGYFYEWLTEDLDVISRLASKRSQTLSYFGVNKEVLKSIVVKNKLAGIDRIVPIGRGLDMDLVWDGYDLVRSMSRVISVS